jgi:hypothetical protein
MTLDLSHLAASVKEEAFHDAPTRVRFVQTARWVEFARGRLALEELERRYQYPTCARMPCMLLYGDSGMGKTMLIEKMERQHPNSHHERRGLTLRPVLRVQMPASPDERRFYTRLLELLGAPYTSHDQIGALENRVLHILAEIGTKLLCIDEVHHLLAGSQREQRRALNLLKFVAMSSKSPSSWWVRRTRFTPCKSIRKWRVVLNPCCCRVGQRSTAFEASSPATAACCPCVSPRPLVTQR